MENNRLSLLILVLGFISLNVYLFASAPAPLPDGKQSNAGKKIPIEQAFTLLAAENDAVRSLYTQKIVGQGQKVKLAFQEDWKDKGIEAGPLPALFLRGTATFLEKHPVPLGLFLGSDFPISSSNKFKGIQETYFNQIKEDKQPKFFFDEGTRMYTAMFPDVANVATCVSCHNNHKDSPKTNWKLNDIIGATTWTYPEDSVSVEKLTEMINAYRSGAQTTYEGYLAKTRSFTTTAQPTIGTLWPERGYYLPTTEVFMDSVNQRVSPYTLKQLLLVAR